MRRISEGPLTRARARLVLDLADAARRAVLAETLDLLGIEVPERM